MLSYTNSIKLDEKVKFSCNCGQSLYPLIYNGLYYEIVRIQYFVKKCNFSYKIKLEIYVFESRVENTQKTIKLSIFSFKVVF